MDTIRWTGDHMGCAELIEQTLLPETYEYVTIKTQEEMWDAIKRLAVRGAPAIGIAGAMGMVLGLQQCKSKDDFLSQAQKTREYLAGSRPTAVNLFWALDRMYAVCESCAELGLDEARGRLLQEAIAIYEEDKTMCRRIGEYGQSLLADGDSCLTHCNAGGLATADYGTALALFFAAHENGKSIHVFADETRPLLQGGAFDGLGVAAA
jgi:methylthioribose-1-phosphate isomerase